MPTGRFRLLGPGGRNISAKVLSDALGLEAGAEADSELHAGLEVLVSLRALGTVPRTNKALIALSILDLIVLTWLEYR